MHQATVQLASTHLHSDSTLSDKDLLNLCKQYGRNTLVWRQKFVALLPEVEKRKLYVKLGYGSTIEFAARLAGISKDQTLRVIQLEKKFKSTPELKKLLVSGEVSVNKLARVASVVNEENQDFWASKSQLLSQHALETLVRDTKVVRAHSQESNKTVHSIQQVPQSKQLQLSSKMHERLLALQNKGMNLEELMEEFLNQREKRIQEEKERLAQELREKVVKQIPNIQPTGQTAPRSRYIPVGVKKVLKQEYGDKCAHEYCTNKSTTIHHKRRFATDPSHNPLYLLPMCKQHHEITHAIDVRVQEQRRRCRESSGYLE